MQVSPSRWYRPAILVAVVALGLLWPAVVNGGPFWFPDTTTYIRGADAAVAALTGQQTEWSDRLVSSASRASAASATPAAESAFVPTRPVITGRSIYYGFLLYLPMRIFGLWGAIALQALLVAGILTACLAAAARALGANPRVAVPACALVLLALTPLPYFTSMLMPDVYSGMTILTLVTVICFWDTMRGLQRVLLVAASAAMATFHTTHVLLAVVIGAAGLLFLARRHWVRVGVVAAPVIAAIVAGNAFTYGVRAQLGQTPLSPPFLSARLTASGPGTEFLRTHCDSPVGEFALCAYRERLPLDSDSFLWSSRADNGLFQIVGPAEQRRIASEDKAFFLAVLCADPAGFLRSSAQSVADTVTTFDLLGFNYTQGKGAVILDKLPPGPAAQMSASRAYAQDMPTAFAVRATVALTVLSLIATVLLAMSASRIPNGAAHTVRRYLFLTMIAVFANAVICGTLSKATARYQMRLIWLLPAVTVMAGAARRGPGVARATPASGRSDAAHPLVDHVRNQDEHAGVQSKQDQ